MANPNPEIYRTPEHWVQCKILSGTNEGVNRPKIVDWCGDNQRRTGTIGSTGAVPNGYLQASEPLDVTLCPTGQHPNVSCFSEIWRFQNPQSDAAAAIPTEKIERKNAPCNWTFGEVDALFTSIFGSLRDKASPLQRWSPNSANDRGDNTNWNFCPFVTWGVRGALLQIKVMTITEYDTFNGVQIPRYNTNNIMSLDEWKNNHSDKPIQSLDFTFYGNTGEDTAIRYATNWIYNDGTCVGACSIDSCGEYAGEPYYDYTRAMFNRNNALILLPAGLAANYNNTGDSIYFYALDKLQGAEIRGVANSDDGWRLGAVVPYSTANYNTILKMAACFAMAFTPTSKNTFTLTDNDYYLPIIRDDGISYGEYTHGSENETNPTADISDIRTINYDPTTPFDPNVYSDTTSWNNVNFINAFTKRYILTSSMVGQLSSELWAAQSSKPADIDFQNFAVDEYLTNNPIDTIVSLKYFPCHFDDVAPTIVYLGKYQTSIAGAIGLGTTVRVIDFAPIEVYRHFGDFRDFEPYTQLSMYIPFCGTVSIPTAEVMGNYVSVKLCIDVGTGAATGYVIVSKTGSGGICVATATGTAAIDIPVSGLQSANLSQAVFNAAAQWTQTQISNLKVSSGLMQVTSTSLSALQKGYAGAINTGSITKALKGGPLGAFTFATDTLNPISAFTNGANIEIENAKAEYNLTHIDMPTRLIGSISPALSSVIESNCRLIIYRPITDETALTNYGNTVGYATLKGGKVSQFSGFTVGTIDVSGINATVAEKQAIAAAFANGVYL